MKKIEFSEYLFNKNFANFLLKLIFIYLIINILIIQIDNKISRQDGKVIALYFKGAVTNPEVFWKSAEQYRSVNRYDKAIVDIELAIGLLEANSAPQAVLARYQSRLDELRQVLLITQGGDKDSNVDLIGGRGSIGSK